MKFEKLLDKIQRTVSKFFSPESFLGNQENVNKIIDWVSFYRANLHRFAQHYLGIRLHLYQTFTLYRLGVSDETVIVAARATAKSFIIAIYACCKAILFPNSMIVIASSTLKQAKIIVADKIEKELMGMSPALCAEIKQIRTHGDEIEVVFWNGSTITVVVGNENARGHRSTVLIYEEFRMIKKYVIDSVLSQFQIVRNTGYKNMPEYAALPAEESISIYISSAWYRSHWMWGVILDNARHVMKDDSRYSLLAFDYVITLYHKIKTRAQLMKDKRKIDPTTWKIECENIMIGENEHAYFTYEMLATTQKIKLPIYPRPSIDSDAPKRGSCLPHQEGEIRLLSCDMAFVDRKGNDNSIFSVIRLLPEESASVGFSYQKNVVYMESIHGGDTVRQARRIKQIFYDCDCDYCVLDARNAGIAVYDMLARVMLDEASQTEFPPWRCINDDATANRIRVDGAQDVLFIVNASAKLNSDIAITMRREIMDGHIGLLIPYSMAMDDVLPKIKGYSATTDLDEQMVFEKPYIETQAAINEMIGLVYEKMPDTGIIKIQEQGANTKDRYTSISYGIYFATLFERDLISAGSQYEYGCYVN